MDQPILGAGARLIRRRGADGWSLAEVAALAEVDEDEVREHYATEWDVFRAVIFADEVQFEDEIRKTESMPASEAIVAVFEACVPDFDWTYWIELWSLALRDRRARDFRQELDTRWRREIQAIIQRGCAEGSFKVDDVGVAAIAIGTLIDSMAVNATLKDTTVRPNYMLDACVTVATSLLGANLRLRAQDEARDG